jgi:hypothetical protein
MTAGANAMTRRPHSSPRTRAEGVAAMRRTMPGSRASVSALGINGSLRVSREGSENPSPLVDALSQRPGVRLWFARLRLGTGPPSAVGDQPAQSWHARNVPPPPVNRAGRHRHDLCPEQKTVRSSVSPTTRPPRYASGFIPVRSSLTPFSLARGTSPSTPLRELFVSSPVPPNNGPASCPVAWIVLWASMAADSSPSRPATYCPGGRPFRGFPGGPGA